MVFFFNDIQKCTGRKHVPTIMEVDMLMSHRHVDEEEVPPTCSLGPISQ